MAAGLIFSGLFMQELLLEENKRLRNDVKRLMGENEFLVERLLYLEGAAVQQEDEQKSMAAAVWKLVHTWFTEMTKRKNSK